VQVLPARNAIHAHTYLRDMKKKKRYKGKNTKARSPVSIAQGREASREEVPEGKDISQPPLRRELVKKADEGGFALKRYITIARQFLSDAKVELKKVTWPNRKELLTTTVIVIVLVLIISFYLGIVDLGLVKIVKNLIR
jgi:preprotein translocase subunit SecE